MSSPANITDGTKETMPGSPAGACCSAPRRFRSEWGQAVVEFAFVLPILLLIALGVIGFSHLIYNQSIVSRLTREGSNLISRDISLLQAATAMKSMVNPPVNFENASSKLIFTVLTKPNKGTNSGSVIVYQRYEIGGLAAASNFKTRGSLTSSMFGEAPDYIAVDPEEDIKLQVTNVPSNLSLDAGQFVYVTEVHSKYPALLSLTGFGISLPSTLYSIAYF